MIIDYFFFIRDEYFSTQDTYTPLRSLGRSLVVRAQLLLRATKMMKDKVLVYRLMVFIIPPAATAGCMAL